MFFPLFGESATMVRVRNHHKPRATGRDQPQNDQHLIVGAVDLCQLSHRRSRGRDRVLHTSAVDALASHSNLSSWRSCIGPQNATALEDVASEGVNSRTDHAMQRGAHKHYCVSFRSRAQLAGLFQLLSLLVLLPLASGHSFTRTALESYWSSEPVVFPNLIANISTENGAGSTFDVTFLGGVSSLFGVPAVDKNGTLSLPLSSDRVGGQAGFTVSLILCTAAGDQTLHDANGTAMSNGNQTRNSTFMTSWNPSVNVTNGTNYWNQTQNSTTATLDGSCSPRVVLNQTFTISIFVGSVDFRLDAAESANLSADAVQQNLSAYLAVDDAVLEVTNLIPPSNSSRRLLATALSLQVRVRVPSSAAAQGVLAALNSTLLSSFLGGPVSVSGAAASLRDAAGRTALVLSVQSYTVRDDAGTVSISNVVAQILAPQLPMAADGNPAFTLAARVTQFRQSSSTGALGPWQTGEPSSLLDLGNASCSVCIAGENVTFAVLPGAGGEVLVELSALNGTATSLLNLTIQPISAPPRFELPVLPAIIPENTDLSFRISNMSGGGWRLAPNIPTRFEFSTSGIDVIQSVLFSDNCTLPGTESCEAVLRPYPMRFGNTSFTITMFNDAALYTPHGVDNVSLSVDITVSHENVAPTFTLTSEVIRVEEDSACVLSAGAASTLVAPSCNTSIPLYHRYESYVNVLLGMFEEQTGAACPPSAGWTTAPGACLDQRGTFNLSLVSGDAAVFSSAPEISADGTLTFALSADMNGQATFNVTLTDDGITRDGQPTPKSATQLLTIFVFPINDRPTFELASSISAIEGTGTNSLPVISNSSAGPFEPAQSVSFILTPGPGASDMFSRYYVSGNMVVFTLRPAAFGLTYLNFTAKDDGGIARGGVDTSLTKTLAIRVWPVNNPPSFVFPNPTVLVNESVRGVVRFEAFATNITAGSPNEDCEVASTGCESQSVTFLVDHVERDFLFARPPTISHTGTLSFAVQPSTSGSTRVYVRLEDDAGTTDTSGTHYFDVVVQTIEHAPSFALRRRVECLSLETRSPAVCTCAPTTEPQFLLPACGRAEEGAIGSTSVLKDAGAVFIEAFATHITSAENYLHASMTIFTVDNSTGRLRFQEQRQDPIWGSTGLEYATDMAASPEGNHLYALEYDLDTLLIFGQNGTDAQFLDRRESVERRLRFVGFNDDDRFDRTPLALSTPGLRSLSLLEAAGKQFVLAASGTEEPAKDVERRRTPPPPLRFPFVPQNLWELTTAMWVFSPADVFLPVSLPAEDVAARFYIDQRDFPFSNPDGIWNRTWDVSCSDQGCSVRRPVNGFDTESCEGLTCDRCAEVYETYVQAASIRDLTGKMGPLLLPGPACKNRPQLNQTDWDVSERQMDVRTFLMSNFEVDAMQFDGRLNPGMYLTLDINQLVTGDPATTKLPQGDFSVELWVTIDGDQQPATVSLLDRELRGLVGVEAYRRFPFCGRGWAVGYRHSVGGTTLEFHIFTEGTLGSEYQHLYTTPSPIAKGEWQHVVAVYEDPAAKLYLNGQEVYNQQACAVAPCGKPVYPARAGLPTTCDDKPFNFSVGTFFNGMDEMVQARSGDPVLPHVGAMHLVRIYDAPLDAVTVLAQYNDREALMARNPLEQTFWTVSTQEGREAPQYDFVDMAISSDVVIRGSLDLTLTYRCEWLTETEGELSATVAKVSYDSAYRTHVLECHTPLWNHGVRVTTMRVAQWHEGSSEWKPVWMKVCLDAECGMPTSSASERERWFWGTETVVNNTRGSTLRNNVDGMPFRFRFLAASSILQMEIEEEVGGGAVERVVIVSGGVNYVDGIFTGGIVGEGRLLSGRFTVDEGGAVATATIDVAGMAYPTEGGEVKLLDSLGHSMTNSITGINLSTSGAGFLAGSWEVLGADGATATGTFNVSTGSDSASVGKILDLSFTQGGSGYTSDPVAADLQFYFAGTRETQEGKITQVLGADGFISGVNMDVDCVANCSSSACTGSGFLGKCVAGGGGTISRVDVITRGSGYNRDSPPDMFCVVGGQLVSPVGITLEAVIPKRPSVSIFRAQGARVRFETRHKGLQDLSIFGLPRAGLWNAANATEAILPCMANSTNTSNASTCNPTMATAASEQGVRPLWEGASSFTPFIIDNSSYFIHANWWDGVVGNKFVVSNVGRVLSMPKSFLYSWDPYVGVMQCVQAIATAGSTEWVHFSNSVGDFVAVANYQQVLPNGETTTRTWSRIYRFGDSAQTEPPRDDRCSSDSAHGSSPIDEANVTEIATKGATGMETFVMNHSTRLSLIQYLVVTNYYDSETDSTMPPSKLYMLGSPVSATETVFGISSTVSWKTCSDTGASCSVDSDCFVHTCSERCVVTRRGNVIDKVCRCSNALQQSCREDSECYAGLTCSYGGISIQPEDHSACFAQGDVRFVGTNYQHLVTACEMQSFPVERASDVAHTLQGTKHFLAFASDSALPAQVFVSEDGAQAFAPLPSVPARYASSVSFFNSPISKHLYHIVTQRQDASALISRWNGTEFVLDHKVAVDGGQSGLHLIHRGVEYGVFGGSTSSADGSTLLFSAYDDTLPTLDGPNSVAISPSGSHVYVASLATRSILCFLREREEGTLAYLFSISMASTGSVSLAGVNERADSYGYPVRGVLDMVVSPDGRNVYLAASQDNAIHTYWRNESSGELVYRASVTDADRSKMMQGPRQLVATADGTRVYAICVYSQSIVALDRSPVDGSLAYRDTIVNGERRVVSLESEVQPDRDGFPTQLGAAEDAAWKDSVRSTKYFTVDGQRFLALAASDDDEDAPGLAVVMMWNETSSRFEQFQELMQEQSSGPTTDVEVFEVTGLDGNSLSYLAVANARGTIRVYVFSPDAGGFLVHHTLAHVPLPYNATLGCSCLCSQPSSCGACFGALFTAFPQCPVGAAGCQFTELALSPRRIKHFTVAQTGEHFLAVANYFSVASKCPNVYSAVYRWNGDAPRSAQGQTVWGYGFEPFQAFATHGALDVDFIAIGSDTGTRNLLFVANSAQGMAGDVMVWEHTAYAYNHMLQARAGSFQLIQRVPGQGISAVHAMFIEDEGVFLAVGSRQTARFSGNISVYSVSPELLRWNSTGFEHYQTLVGDSVPDETSYFPDPQVAPNVSAVPGVPTWTSLNLLAGVSGFKYFEDLDGERYLVLALSFCDPGTNRTACRSLLSQPQSAILQWDRTNAGFTEMLAWADRLYEEVHEEPVHEEIRRHHQAALRMPVGRALRVEAFTLGDQVMLVTSSLDKGATVIRFLFDTSPGFGGAMTLAVDSSHNYLYVASEDEQAVVVFGLFESFDSVGNPVSIFEHIQSLSQLPLRGHIDPVPQGLQGVRYIALEEQDCTGYVVDGKAVGAEAPEPRPNGTALIPSTTCMVVVVRGSVPRNQFPCSDHPTDALMVDPLEPELECRQLAFNSSVVSASNPDLFAVEPYLVPSGPLMGSLNFTVNPGQSGTARLQAQLFKSPSSITAAPLSMLESEVLYFDVNVIDINDAPTFALVDVNFVMDAGEQESVFAVNITAEGLGLANYTWEWDYVCPSNTTANCTNGTAYTGYRPDVFASDPVLRFSETQDGLVGIIKVDVVPLIHDRIPIFVRMNDGSEPDPATGSLHVSEVVVLTIVVLPINHAPTFVANPPYIEFLEGERQQLKNFVTAIENGPDEENRTQALFYAVDYVEDVNVFGWNTSNIFQEFAVVGRDLSFQLHPDFNGEIIVYIRISDDGGTALGGEDRSSIPVRVTVLPVNDRPRLEGNGRAFFTCRTRYFPTAVVSWTDSVLAVQNAAESVDCDFTQGSGTNTAPSLCSYSNTQNARGVSLADLAALNGQGPDTVDWESIRAWDPPLSGPFGGQEDNPTVYHDWYVGLHPGNYAGHPRVPGDFAYLQSGRMPWVSESVTLVQTPGVDVTTFRTERVLDATVSFYLSMFSFTSSTIGTISVSVRFDGGPWVSVPFITINDVDLTVPFRPVSFSSRDNWLLVSFPLNDEDVLGREVEIRFTAVRGTADSDSTALDTVSLTSDVEVDLAVETCTIEFNITGVLVDTVREVPGAFTVDQPVDEDVVETITYATRVLSGSELFFADPSVTEAGTFVLPLSKAGRGVADVEVVLFDSEGLNTTYQVRVRIDEFEELPPFALRPVLEAVDGDGPQSEPEFAVINSLEEVPDSAQRFIRFTVVCTSTAPGMFLQAPAIDSVGTLTWEIREGYSGRAQCTVVLQAQEAGIEDTSPQLFSLRVWPRPQLHSVQPAVLPARQTGSVVTVRGRNFGSLRSRGYSAASYGNVTVLVTGGFGGRSGQPWMPCVSTTFVSDGELLCEVPAGEGRRDIKVEILDGINRTGVSYGGVLSVDLWFVGIAEDQHCASLGMPWPHRQEGVTECGSRGFVGYSPISDGGQEIGEVLFNVSSSVRSVSVSGGRVYVGGGFATVNALRVNSIFGWDGKDVTALQLGLDGSVAAMEPYVDALGKEKLAVAGSFTRAYTSTGSVSTGGVAFWDESANQWEAAGGSEVHGVALCLGVRGATMLAGGKFTAVGDVKAMNVAMFNGSKWSALGEGVVGEVYACAVSAGAMYVGGKLRMAGGEEVDNVAGWNGKSWGALLDGECLHHKRGVCGINGRVLAMATVGEYLYVGGMFDTAGGKPANNVARFYSGVWEPLGMGVDGKVTVMSSLRVAESVSGSCVYIAGAFQTASDRTGDTEVNGLARWCVGDPVLVRVVAGQVMAEFWQAVAVPEGVRGIRAMAPHLH